MVLYPDIAVYMCSRAPLPAPFSNVLLQAFATLSTTKEAGWSDPSLALPNTNTGYVKCVIRLDEAITIWGCALFAQKAVGASKDRHVVDGTEAPVTRISDTRADTALHVSDCS